MEGEETLDDRHQVEAWFREYGDAIYTFLVYYTETAAVLSWSVSKVNVTYHRAIRLVREIMRAELIDGSVER